MLLYWCLQLGSGFLVLSSLLPSQETLWVVSLLHAPLWTEAAPLQLCPKSSGNTQVCNKYGHCSCLPPHLPSHLQPAFSSSQLTRHTVGGGWHGGELILSPFPDPTRLSERTDTAASTSAQQSPLFVEVQCVFPSKFSDGDGHRLENVTGYKNIPTVTEFPASPCLA